MKTALCTTLAEVFAIRNVTKPTLEPIQSLNLTTTLQDRAFCEEDVNLQQLLPYLVTARHIPVGSHNVRQYFMYRRGKAGNEAKLHDKLSIGLGGHVDNGVPEDEQSDQPFLRSVALNRLLQLEAAREYKEECSVSVSADAFKFTHFIIDPMEDDNEVPVASVHLGLLAVLDVSVQQSESMTGEDATCVDPQWVTLNELLSPEIYCRLETWSRLVVDALYAGAARIHTSAAQRYQSNPKTHIVTVHQSSGYGYKTGLPSALDSCIDPQEVYKLPEPASHRAQIADDILARFAATAPVIWAPGGSSVEDAIDALSQIVRQVKEHCETQVSCPATGDDLTTALAALTAPQLASALRRLPLTSKHVAEVVVAVSSECYADGVPVSFTAAVKSNPVGQEK